MELASRSQLRMSFIRWALVTVPLILLLGFLSGQVAGSGEENGWYAALAKPALNPPGWVFPVAWSILYILMGIAIALVLNARGARLRGAAIALFLVQLALNLAWSPIFFGMHQVTTALFVIAAMFAAALGATLLFGRIRTAAAWAMVPYLAWLCFAGALNYGILSLNPDAETLYVPAARTQI